MILFQVSPSSRPAGRFVCYAHKNTRFALTIIFVIYAIGDIVSTKPHAIVSILVGKIFHESWYLCCAMSITALFGFPGTVIVPTEVTKAVAEAETRRSSFRAASCPR